MLYEITNSLSLIGASITNDLSSPIIDYWLKTIFSLWKLHQKVVYSFFSSKHHPLNHPCTGFTCLNKEYAGTHKIIFFHNFRNYSSKYFRVVWYTIKAFKKLMVNLFYSPVAAQPPLLFDIYLFLKIISWWSFEI